MARVYVGSTDDTHTHLAALDASGAQLFRMRTRFWAIDDLHRVTELIGAPLTRLPEPVSSKDFTQAFAPD